MSKSGRNATLGTLVGSGAGFIFPFALALRYSAGPETDAYLFAYGVAIFGATIFAGAVEANFLPVATSIRNGARLSQVTRKRFSQTLLVAATAYTVILCLAWFLIGGNGDWFQAQRSAAFEAVLAMSGFAVLSASNGVLAAALYSLDRFAVPTLTVCFRSLAPLILLFVLPRTFDSIVVLAAAVSFGEMCRTAVLFLLLRRGLANRSGTDKGSASTGFWRTVGPHALNMLVLTTSPVIDRSFAARQGEGAVTLLDLGEKVLYVPVTALTAVFILVASARWAEKAAETPRDLGEDFWATTRRGWRVSWLAVIVTITGVALTTAVVPGGKFAGVIDSEFRTIVIYFLLGLPFAIVSTMGARLLTSVRQTSKLPALAVLAVSVNASADFVGAQIAGVNGIALASTLTRLVSAIAVIYVVRGVLRSAHWRGTTNA